MARTINEIYEEIVQAVQEKEALELKLTSKSKTAIWRLWAYVTASVIYILELLFDRHRDEMENLISKHHAHTLNWYETKAKQFVKGAQLIPFTGKYPEDLIKEEDMIVKHAACTRVINPNGRVSLQLKVAKEDKDNLVKLDNTDLPAFKDYMREIRDAGVDMDVISHDPDLIEMEWIVYYDPQILDETGRRHDNGKEVIITAIKEYLNQLSFNGIYIKSDHEDFLKKVQGIRLARICSARISKNGSQMEPAEVEEVGIVPYAGYIRINDTYGYDHLYVEKRVFNPADNSN